MTERPTVLVVDAETSSVDLYKVLLVPRRGRLLFDKGGSAGAHASAGFRFRLLTARSEEGAIELVQRYRDGESRIWICFIDLTQLGLERGLGAIREMRQLDPALSFVITGCEEAWADEVQARFSPEALDNLDFMLKPFTPVELRQRAHRAASAWRLRQRMDNLSGELERQNKTLSELVRTRTHELEKTSVVMGQMQDELVRSEARLRAIIESASDGILIARRGQNVIDLNRSAEGQLEAPKSQVIGRPLDELFAPAEGVGVFSEVIERCLEGKLGPARLEVLGKRPNGTHFPAELAMTSFRTAEDSYVAVFFLDVTEKKNAEKRMRELSRDLLDTARRAGMAEVATGVLHNLGNVLNTANVTVSVLVDRVKKLKIAGIMKSADLVDEDVRGRSLAGVEKMQHLPKYLRTVSAHLLGEQQVILSELQRVVESIEHIKGIVSMQQNYAKGQGFVEEMPVAEVFDDAIKLGAPVLDRYQVKVVRDYQVSPRVKLDRHKLLQIIMNLVTNARDALKELPEDDRVVYCRIRPNGVDRVLVEVEDRGRGISPEAMGRIFSLGFTTKKDGHGFGLHFSALAVKDLGGSLTVKSEGLGCGAKFTVDLPVSLGRSTSLACDLRYLSAER